jgi:hypothetical protein
VTRLLGRLHLHWIIDVRASARLGYRRVDAVRLAAFHVTLAVADVLGVVTRRSLTVRLAPDGDEVVIQQPGEIAVLSAILLHGEYESASDPAVDLGANVGFASLFFARRHPRARVFAVEADPRTCARLVRNVCRAGQHHSRAPRGGGPRWVRDVLLVLVEPQLLAETGRSW